MTNLKVKFKKLDKKTKVPTRAHDTDSGWDLEAIGVEKIVGDTIFFKTGIAAQSPSGYYLELFPRSSISKLPLSLANSIGVIDEGYTAEILVPIRVHHSVMGQEIGNTSFANGIVKIFGTKPNSMLSLAELIITKQPKLCQLVLKKRYDAEFIEVDELDKTERGSGGFGSTNK